jgi:hypothetical protein
MAQQAMVMLTEEICNANGKPGMLCESVSMKRYLGSQGSMRELQIMVIQRQEGKYGFQQVIMTTAGRKTDNVQAL